MVMMWTRFAVAVFNIMTSLNGRLLLLDDDNWWSWYGASNWRVVRWQWHRQRPIIASTKTWALLISSWEIMFLIVAKLASAEEIIRELVFSWWVITVLAPSLSGINPLETELRIAAISADFAYFKYTTSIESSVFTSSSRDLSVSLILLVTYSFAETITELGYPNILRPVCLITSPQG